MASICLVMNKRSGTRAVTPDRGAALAARLRDLGNEVAAWPDEPISEQIRLSTESSCDMLVVAGGDGTIRSAVQAHRNAPKTIAIIPSGTMNMLAREIGLPIDEDAAIAAIADGARRTMDIGEVEGEIFLHSALMGLPVRVGVHREVRRDTFALRGILAAWDVVRIAWHVLMTLRRDPKLTVTATARPDGPEAAFTGYSVVTLAGQLSKEVLPVPLRARIDAGYLTLVVIAARTGGAALRALARSALGEVESDPDVHVVKAREATVASLRRKSHLMLDGEKKLFTTPVTFRIRPRALEVVVPRERTDAPQ